MPTPVIPTPVSSVVVGTSGVGASGVARDAESSGTAGSVAVVVRATDDSVPVAVLSGPAGSAWTLYVDDATAGDAENGHRRWRKAGADLARRARDLRKPLAIEEVVVHLPIGFSADEATAFAIGVVAGSNQFRLTNRDESEPVPRVVLVAADGPSAEFQEAVARGNALGNATVLARDLANLPSNLKPPRLLAEYIRGALSMKPGLTVTVRDEQWLRDHGFGGVLAVGGGSAEPPRLIEMSWQPNASSAAADEHIVLVGKGITFDTGGISVKPALNMHLMKTDMAGSAAVVGAMAAIADLGLPVRVTALIPSAENMLSDSAYRPGDVVTHYGGITSEVTNTDAEGRMVLADALAYATETLDPTLIVDVATLTGAMKIALGMRTGAIFTDDSVLAHTIQSSGASVGEQWWQLPLSSEYADAVKSDIADIRQAPSGPGAITAALFLQQFVRNARWAHLDIAGPARSEETYDEVNPVASGFSARTLAVLVETLASTA
ncbi:leucyl aminopeptidase family protein [Hoyosella rhizosphaerae]|nr:leucyl aminopeptidase family protein [Hoyosella rhizosphaerae]